MFHVEHFVIHGFASGRPAAHFRLFFSTFHPRFASFVPTSFATRLLLLRYRSSFSKQRAE
jgi:hypothetical protein